MASLGTDKVYMRGSRVTVLREVKTDGSHNYIRWYGQWVEVTRGDTGNWYSVDRYQEVCDGIWIWDQTVN